MIYRACLCFSDADAKAAEDLRRALDGKRTPEPLVGLAGANGPAPSRIAVSLLGPIHVYPGGQLSEDVEAVLSGSDGLVVICSPAAAADFALNRVIDRFITLDRSRRVFAVIAPDAHDVSEVERDFFPPSFLGRGALAADLREIKRANGVLVGDGYEAGLLRLHAALLGLSIQRLAEQNSRGVRARLMGVAGAAAILAAGLVVSVGYGLFATHNAQQVEHERQAAQQRAEEATQRSQAALAAREQEANARARAGVAADAERATLRDGAQMLIVQAGGSIDAIAASQSASVSNLRQLRSVEEAIGKIGMAGWVFGVRAETIVGLWEKLANAYAAVGQNEEAQHVRERFSQFSLRLGQNNAADPTWRAAYAASVAALYAPRLAKQDRPGALGALEDAVRLNAAMCAARTADAAAARINARACLAMANLELRRAHAQESAQEPVDAAALTRAQMSLENALAAAPRDAQLQAGGVPLHDQLVRELTRLQDAAQH